MGSTPAGSDKLGAEILEPLKCLNNFWRPALDQLWNRAWFVIAKTLHNNWNIYFTSEVLTDPASNPFTNTLTGRTLFSNYELFIKWITKIDRATIDDTEDLNLVMSMYNLLEYI